MIPYINQSGASIVLLVGKFMCNLRNSFFGNTLVRCYDDVDQLIANMDDYIKGKEMILIKGSRAMNLDKLAKHLGVKDVL